jgi:hypothetical protein
VFSRANRARRELVSTLLFMFVMYVP